MPTTLSQCGTTTATLWAADWNNGQDGAPTDLINPGYEAQYTFLAPTGSDFGQLASQYSEPAVLTYSSGSGALAPLAEIGGNVPATQRHRVLPAAGSATRVIAVIELNAVTKYAVVCVLIA
jgi:hypothetical protein